MLETDWKYILRTELREKHEAKFFLRKSALENWHLEVSSKQRAV